MREFNLPNQLRRHFVNLSSTIQVLIGEIVLSVEGLQAEATRRASTELEEASRNKRATEQLNEQMRSFLGCHQLPPEDATIATAATCGRSTSEIADFLGMEKRYVMRRLCAVRKSVVGWKALREQQEMFDGGEVLELFAEAQKR